MFIRAHPWLKLFLPNSSGLGPDESLDGRKLLADGNTMRSNAVMARRCGNDESFRIMNNKWFKPAVGAFDNGFIALHKLQNVQAAVRVVPDGFGERVSSRFNPFAPGQTRAFFAPAIAAVERFEVGHCVRKIETDRDLITEPRVDGFAEQCARLVENQIDGRKFESQVAETEHQAVIPRSTVEATGVIFLASPGRRIKERNQAERSSGRSLQPATHVFSVGQFRLVRVVRVESVIPTFDERTFPSVSDSPVHKEGALEFEVCRMGFIVRTEIAGFASPDSLLGLPAHEIGVHQKVAPCDQRRAATDNKHQTFLQLVDRPPETPKGFGVKKG
ncbi:MAG TPA: hypothetical protein VNN22_03120, partial [Verrucomicrobiae bacterium]|nr:hypothetical protein [Verrucomicrobiae bacterium]